jgi:hypothetical protein
VQQPLCFVDKVTYAALRSLCRLGDGLSGVPRGGSLSQCMSVCSDCSDTSEHEPEHHNFLKPA